MNWSLKQFAGQKEMVMKATFALPSIASRSRNVLLPFTNTRNLADRDNFSKTPINVVFEIPYFTVSGINVHTYTTRV